ncbi:MAG: hypothetical protein ACXWCY_08150 [Burkholderiales bacterium]
MFDSPFEICEVCKQYVLVDQTHPECAREHDCHVAQCPLKRFFAKAYDEASAGTELDKKG